MYVFLTILIIAVCFLLVLAVLVQNPKGGGLSAAFGGMGNQVMGARRASDFIEKFTWGAVVTLLVLSLVSAVFMPKEGKEEVQKSELEDKVNQTNFPLPPAVDEQATPPADGQSSDAPSGDQPPANPDNP